MEPIVFTFLNGPDIEKLAMTDEEILSAVEAGLRAQGEGQTVIEPRVHLVPDPSLHGHFNVLRGYVAPLNLAGVKIVGDYVDNYTRGLPSEMALLNLFDPRTGMPVALLDATAITEMRTGAMTALGAKYLARRESRVLGHIGARGTAYWNVRLLDRWTRSSWTTGGSARRGSSGRFGHTWRRGNCLSKPCTPNSQRSSPAGSRDESVRTRPFSSGTGVSA